LRKLRAEKDRLIVSSDQPLEDEVQGLKTAHTPGPVARDPGATQVGDPSAIPAWEGLIWPWERSLELAASV
jgi:hypothetical protein